MGRASWPLIALGLFLVAGGPVLATHDANITILSINPQVARWGDIIEVTIHPPYFNSESFGVMIFNSNFSPQGSLDGSCYKIVEDKVTCRFFTVWNVMNANGTYVLSVSTSKWVERGSLFAQTSRNFTYIAQNSSFKEFPEILYEAPTIIKRVYGGIFSPHCLSEWFVYPNGTVKYRWINKSNKNFLICDEQSRGGYGTSDISDEQYQKIVSEFRKASFHELNDSYPNGCIDCSISSLTLDTKYAWKTVGEREGGILNRTAQSLIFNLSGLIPNVPESNIQIPSKQPGFEVLLSVIALVFCTFLARTSK